MTKVKINNSEVTNKGLEVLIEKAAKVDLRKKVIILNKNDDLIDSANRNVLILNLTEEEFLRRTYNRKYPEYTVYLHKAAFIYDAKTGNVIKNRGFL